MQVKDEKYVNLQSEMRLLAVDRLDKIEHIEKLTAQVKSLTKLHEDASEAYLKYKDAMRDLVRQCPTSLTCDNVSHSKKHDLHGAEEECPPLCRYYKALYEAQELLG